MKPTPNRHAFLRRLPGPAILLFFFAFTLFSSQRQGPTFDEQGFLTRGAGYLRGENRIMRVGHPLGLNALNASLLAGDQSVRLPVEDPSWQERSFHRPSELFLWEIGNDVEKVMFLGRLPTIWLGTLLISIAGRWARQLGNREPVVWLAMAVLALDPNILAHSQLATTDLGLAAAATLAGYTLWRFLREPSWSRVLVAGAALGLLQDTKFTAGLFVPLFGVVVVAALPFWWQETDRAKRWRLAMMLVAYPLVGVVTLWAAYGFDVAALPAQLPVLPQLAGRTVPLAHHLEQLLDIGGRMQKSTPAFLAGRYSESGWWYYFPVAFVLKTPLPTLTVLGWALLRSGWQAVKSRPPFARRALLDNAAVLVPPLGYFAIALTTDINLGYRHLLPVLPFLVVFSASKLISGHTARQPTAPANWNRRGYATVLLAATIVFALFVLTLRIYPHPLAYFNVIAGGPENGWRYLVDSNIDWGQDLPNLSDWMEEKEVEHVWLSYFGEGRPEYYGINYTGLDSYPPRLMAPGARPYYPWDPAPGIYAISATTLQGVHFENHDLFAWFRNREPVDSVGYSILIYEVAPYGSPVELALGDIQLDEIDPEQYALLGTNQVTPHWFAASGAWLVPGAGESAEKWLALDRDADAAPWDGLIESHYVVLHETETSTLLRQRSTPSLPAARMGQFTRWNSVFELIDASGNYRPGERLTFLTRWQQKDSPTPLKIFIHVVDESDNIIAQWDGLGAAWQGWRRGDVLYQRHEFDLPHDLAPGVYDVWVGLYEPASGERWRIGGADRLLLTQISVDDE